MRTALVYRATSPSNKSYIGTTVKTLEQRKACHISDALSRIPFRQAIEKYGDDLLWEVLISGVPERLKYVVEARAIDVYKTISPNGYNLQKEGDREYFVHEDTRKKLSESNMGHVVREETRQKIRRTLSGRSHSSERRAAISKGRLASDKNRGKQC